MTSIELSAAGILLGGFALLMLAMFSVALVRGLVWRRQTDTSAAVAPELQDVLVDYVSGNNDLTRIRTFARTNRRDVAAAMMRFEGALGGSALDRLCDLALNLGLVGEWVHDAHSRDSARRRTAFARLAFVSVYEPCRRFVGDMLFHALSDPDPEISLWACRAAIQSGTGEQVEAVFDLAVSGSFLTRILLTEALRRYANPLCEHAVPQALRSPDSHRVLAVLDMLVAWERAVAIDNLPDLVGHRNKDIRIQALKLVPLIPLTPENRAAIVRGLADPDPEVSTAAALSAARLKLEEALPALARMLRVASAELARTAAAALAEMPPRGWEALEEFSTSPNLATAAAAEGALERARRRTGL
ncbi:MAG: HEAT repeat domain-containing protein [Acidobacteriia bacterium]|nr:HEAT repeat domain-containing protein [Terriglobia bacterium]